MQGERKPMENLGADPLVAHLRRCCLRVMGKKPGCGFVVAPQLLITCSHVVGAATLVGETLELRAWDSGGVADAADRNETSRLPLPAEVLANDEISDLALLRLLTEGFPYVALDGEVRLGDPLVAIGFPHENQRLELDQFTAEFEAEVNFEDATGRGPSLVELKFKGGQVRHGFSGGPLLNRRTWRVIGVVAVTRDARSPMGGFAKPLSSIKALLDSTNQIIGPLDPLWHKAEEHQRKLANSAKYDPHKTHQTLPLYTPNNLPEQKKDATLFVGRDGLIAEINRLLEDDNSHIYITGMGGVGKTELAIQYAYHNSSHYKGGIVWIDARQGIEEMRADIISFFTGTFPNVSLITLEGLPENQLRKTLVSLCWSNWPTSSAKPEPVLLILDDQEGGAKAYINADELFRGLPPRFRRITTQREPPPSTKKGIKLSLLQREDSLRLLSMHSGPYGYQRIEDERQKAENICERVGDLPLALVLLGAKLRDIPDLSISQLLQDLLSRDTVAEALTTAHPELGAHRGVVETLLLSWGNLAEPSKRLALLLGIMSPSILPWRIVEFCELYGGDVMDDSLRGSYQGELIRHQLLERASKNLYIIHPLVRQFFITQGKLHPDLLSELRKQVIRTILAICKRLATDSLDLVGCWDMEYITSHISFLADALHEVFSDEDIYTVKTSIINGLRSLPPTGKGKIFVFLALTSFPRKFDISLEGLHLGGVELRGLDLSHLDFSGTYLVHAKFTGCSFYETNFSGADLRGACFEMCQLKGSIFRGANMTGASLPLCDLSGADFRGSTFNRTSESPRNFLIMSNEEEQELQKTIEFVRSSVLDIYGRLISIGNPAGANTMRIAYLVHTATFLSSQDHDAIVRLKSDGILRL